MNENREKKRTNINRQNYKKYTFKKIIREQQMKINISSEGWI